MVIPHSPITGLGSEPSSDDSDFASHFFRGFAAIFQRIKSNSKISHPFRRTHGKSGYCSLFLTLAGGYSSEDIRAAAEEYPRAARKASGVTGTRAVLLKGRRGQFYASSRAIPILAPRRCLTERAICIPRLCICRLRFVPIFSRFLQRAEDCGVTSERFRAMKSRSAGERRFLLPSSRSALGPLHALGPISFPANSPDLIQRPARFFFSSWDVNAGNIAMLAPMVRARVTGAD